MSCRLWCPVERVTVALHCRIDSALHCTTLNCTTLHCNTLHHTALRYSGHTMTQCSAGKGCCRLEAPLLLAQADTAPPAPLHSTVQYCTALHCTLLCSTALHCTVLHCTKVYCTFLYCTVQCTALHSTVMKCTAM